MNATCRCSEEAWHGGSAHGRRKASPTPTWPSARSMSGGTVWRAGSGVSPRTARAEGLFQLGSERRREFTMTVLRLGQVIELKGRHP